MAKQRNTRYRGVNRSYGLFFMTPDGPMRYDAARKFVANHAERITEQNRETVMVCSSPTEAANRCQYAANAVNRGQSGPRVYVGCIENIR